MAFELVTATLVPILREPPFMVAPARLAAAFRARVPWFIVVVPVTVKPPPLCVTEAFDPSIVRRVALKVPVLAMDALVPVRDRIPALSVPLLPTVMVE
ncbi:MAG: hypothetical protein LIP18_06545 [Planctomycetes bacterium]|nr:hypothetical protein [Planctomycetota bacterium]